MCKLFAEWVCFVGTISSYVCSPQEFLVFSNQPGLTCNNSFLNILDEFLLYVSRSIYLKSSSSCFPQFILVVHFFSQDQISSQFIALQPQPNDSSKCCRFSSILLLLHTQCKSIWNLKVELSHFEYRIKAGSEGKDLKRTSNLYCCSIHGSWLLECS